MHSVPIPPSSKTNPMNGKSVNSSAQVLPTLAVGAGEDDIDTRATSDNTITEDDKLGLTATTSVSASEDTPPPESDLNLNAISSDIHQKQWLSNLFAKKRIEKSFCTKADWNLFQGMLHILNVHDGIFRPIIIQEGIPSIFHNANDSTKNKINEKNKENRDDEEEEEEEILQYKSPKNCFQSLCRIISGQQLAGPAAQKIWSRLLAANDHDLTPTRILKFVSDGNLKTHLLKPSGISRAKANSIVELAEAFQDGRLSESFLTSADEEKVREELLKVKGIGPWSVHMFFIFYLEKPNIFPIGDLAVRKGIARLFSLKGKGKNGSLDVKKDAEKMYQIMDSCQPFQSLATFYLYKVVDSKDSKLQKRKSSNLNSSPSRQRKRVSRKVTP